MARVIMFVTGLSQSFALQNQTYRQRVEALIRAHIGSKELNFSDLIQTEVVGDENECDQILKINKDCEVVFTMQGHDPAQRVATKQGLRVYEYREREYGCIVEVKITKKRHSSYSKESINLFGV